MRCRGWPSGGSIGPKHQPKPHWRSDIPALFDEMLQEARGNGFHQTIKTKPFSKYGR
jgi:hypothetical protein